MFEMDPISVLLILLITSVILLLFSTIWLLRKLEEQKNSYHKIIDSTKNRARNLMEETRLKAGETLLVAERSAGQYLSERKSEIDRMHASFTECLEDLSREAGKSLSESVKKVSEFSDEMLHEARTKMDSTLDKANEDIKRSLDLAIENMEEKMNRTSEDLNVVESSVKQLEVLNSEARKAFEECGKCFDRISNEMSEEARANSHKFSQQLEEMNNDARNAFEENARNLERISGEMSEEARANSHKFSQQLEEMNNDARNVFAENAQNLERISGEMSEEARDHLRDSVLKATSAIEEVSKRSCEQMNEEIGKVSEDISASKAEFIEMLKGAFNKELEDLKREVKEYRRDRMRVVDEQIVTLVEETAQIALNTKLTHDDHREVIINALEEAKKRGAFE